MQKTSFLALLGENFPEKHSGPSVKGGVYPPLSAKVYVVRREQQFAMRLPAVCTKRPQVKTEGLYSVLSPLFRMRAPCPFLSLIFFLGQPNLELWINKQSFVFPEFHSHQISCCEYSPCTPAHKHVWLWWIWNAAAGLCWMRTAESCEYMKCTLVTPESWCCLPNTIVNIGLELM